MRYAVVFLAGQIVLSVFMPARAAECVENLKVEQGAIGNIIACLVEMQDENNDLRQITGGIPSGAIIAFERGERAGGACPGGWTLYREAGGRTIIGAGQHSNQGVSSYPSYIDNSERAVGGEEAHLLTVDEMPKHSHRISTGFGVGWHNGLAGSFEEVGIDPVFNDPNPSILRSGGHGIQERVLEEVGGTKSHNNMPPYIALYYCRKD